MQLSKLKCVSLLLAIGLWLCSGIAAADVEAGFKALKTGDYATALAQWRADALKGDAVALQQLGGLYERGQGVPGDPYTAFVLYRVALGVGNRNGEEAANRVANVLAGDELVQGVAEAKRLVAERRYLPNLPGAPMIAAAPTPAAPAAERGMPPQRIISRQAAPPGVAPKRFEFRSACRMQLRYQDEGSGDPRRLALFQPEPEPGFFIVGGLAQSNYDNPDDCVLTLRAGPGDDGLLVPPAGWDKVWRDKSVGARHDGSIWRARSPDPDHVCLGDVGQAGQEMPAVPAYRCVHRCLVNSVTPTWPLWTTEGTRARYDVAVYRLPQSRGFVATPPDRAPAQLADLDPNATCY